MVDRPDYAIHTVDVLNIDVPDHRPGEPVPTSEHDPEGIVVGGVFYSGEEGL